ncbi:Integral membrane protein [Bacillus thuringiensis YBT-1518]|uniref:Integral membrane protein n=1 Tax=Bacillus thuringiensis YBT-1518 TaxID=529122 RepID=A0A9W3KCK8_BACTU|nr:Integral membrane protein [Bacillus thuringiensis YBT-1518]
MLIGRCSDFIKKILNRFLGWFILSILTIGIGFLWLAPYFYATSAAFYEEISKEYYKKEGTTF